MMFRDELDLAEYDFDPIYWQDREKLKERVSIRYSVLPKPGAGRKPVSDKKQMKNIYLSQSEIDSIYSLDLMTVRVLVKNAPS